MCGRQGSGDRRHCGRSVVVRWARCFHAVVEIGEEWKDGWGVRYFISVVRELKAGLK